MTMDGDNREAEFIQGVIRSAVQKNVSNIHFEFSGPSLLIKFRQGDRLAEIDRLPLERGLDVAEHIKRVAAIEPAINGQIQAGKIALEGDPVEAIIDVSAAKFQDKERFVMEIQGSRNWRLSLELPGLTDAVRDILANALAEQNGVILFTGPAEPDEMATMRALVRQLDDKTQNICTVAKSPDPILENAVHIDINHQDGTTYSAGLKLALRQDPDIVMLQEIPDAETADIAVRAGLNGRLILSTVPANNAVGAIVRMRELKTDPFLLASSLRAVVARRDVRKLCEHCAEPIQADGSLASLLGFDRGEVVYREAGCAHCDYTGFKEEIGIFEAIEVDETIRKIINEGGDESRIASLAFLKRPNIASAARSLVKQGLITAEDGIQLSRTPHPMIIS